MIRIGVMVSGKGRGSNFQAILDGCRSGRIRGEVSVVVGTKADAPAIERARSQNVPIEIVSPLAHPDEAYGEALLEVLHRYEVELLCLAGYMRLLPLPVVEAFEGRCMNVHPALLPFFGGAGMYGEHVHEAVIASGMKVSGCTVHLVDARYDSGPIVLQTVVPVEDDDTPQDLAQRLLPIEHETYVRAVALFAEGRLLFENGRVKLKKESVNPA